MTPRTRSRNSHMLFIFYLFDDLPNRLYPCLESLKTSCLWVPLMSESLPVTMVIAAILSQAILTPITSHCRPHQSNYIPTTERSTIQMSWPLRVSDRVAIKQPSTIDHRLYEFPTFTPVTPRDSPFAAGRRPGSSSTHHLASDWFSN